MKKLIVLCVAIFLTLTLIGVLFLLPLKYEYTSGFLAFDHEICTLSKELKTFKPIRSCKKDDEVCVLMASQEKHVEYFGVDGLSKNFCLKNKKLLGKKIEIVGIRIGGDEIGQDCSNRSCFKSIKLK